MVELELHRGVGGGGQQQQQQQQQHPPLRTRTRWRRRWSISAASRQQQQQQQQHFRSSLRGFGYLERERAKSRVRQEERGGKLAKKVCVQESTSLLKLKFSVLGGARKRGRCEFRRIQHSPPPVFFSAHTSTTFSRKEGGEKGGRSVDPERSPL